MDENIEHTNSQPNSQRVRFVFSYGEHEAWTSSDAPQADLEMDQSFVRFVREREWERQETVVNDLSRFCDPDIQSIDDLMDLTREFIGDGDSDELVQIPFKKLAELMSRDGWSFVGGSFTEFEGHHNDTEIEVVLEREVLGT